MILVVCAIVRAQDPTSQPVLIDASDKSAITSAIGSDVVIQGVVSSAAWSRTGAVMNIEFTGTDRSGLLAVVFQRNRPAFDEAFVGDAAKTITGAKVRIKGRLEEYSGPLESLKGHPQMILTRPDQITVMNPTSQPAE